MRDLLSWNVYVSRLGGVQIRLHAFFVLAFALAIANRDEVPLPLGLACVALLLVSVAWHELAHCLAARKTGGSAEQVLLWPLGGLVQVNTTTPEPRQEWPTAIAGLLANLMVCAFVAPILMVSGSWTSLRLNPLSFPLADSQFPWQAALGLLFWTNWLLIVANLLPAYPLDGARLLRAVLWEKLGYRTAVLQVVRVSKIVALLLLVAALVLHQHYPGAVIPLALLAIITFFGARQEVEKLQDPDADDAPFGYDFSQGYTSLERTTSAPSRHKPGLLRRWLDARREERLRRQRQAEELEDLRVDDVLSRLQQFGMQGLSYEDRALLHRVSLRYRNRPRR
jgi:stage IV sporulation protein FB